MLPATGIVLCGGKNSRMGVNKAFLPVGGREIIQRLLDCLMPILPEIILVTNEPHAYTHLGLKTVCDLIPARGPLSGIHAGLVFSKNFYNLVLACDMPFINAKLVRYLVAKAQGYDLAVPRLAQGLEPLVAVYAKTCLPVIEKNLTNGRLKVVDFYAGLRVNCLSQAEIQQVTTSDVFFNINTPADLDRAEALLRNAKHGPGRHIFENSDK
jgi:molybdopterin-guanine dinucleotide biosynthesis protein A